MDDCIFCRIVKGDIPCRKIYEDDFTIAFLDISPQTKGHTLVIPKKHFANIYEIEEEELNHLINAVKKVSENIKDVLKPEGIKIVQNNGECAGQTVFHIHYHIKPVYEKIEGDAFEKIEIPDDEMEKLTNELKMF